MLNQKEATNIDFCEPPYAVSHYIREMHNTISSLVFVMLGLWGLLRDLADAPGDVTALSLGLVVVGVGSMAFHATGTFAGEFADEAAIVLLCLCMNYSILCRRCHPRRLFTRPFCCVTLMVIGLLVLYAWTRWVYIFLFLMVGLVGWVVGQCRCLSKGRRQKRPMVCMYVAYASWLTEQMIPRSLCKMYHGLHAVWHVWAAVGLYWFIRELRHYATERRKYKLAS
jgi:dihydroceramidase